MKWDKRGLICSHKSFDLPWYRRNTMVPTPFVTRSGGLRVLLTFCDQDNVGRVGWVDLDPAQPSRILGHSRRPSLDVGAPGAFDDHGVVTASVLRRGDELWLYYSGYRLASERPYTIFAGLAISDDEGLSFRRHSSEPLLGPTDAEPWSRCAPIVLQQDGQWRMWYLGDHGGGWIDNGGKLQPRYVTKHLRSADGLRWGDAEGEACLEFQDPREHGLAKPSVWRDGERWRMIYSIRHTQLGYRLGYAESADGVRFKRQDGRVGIDVSAQGWDSEMLCFGSVLQQQGKTRLFYCGNHYGLDGFGYADLASDDE